MVVHDTNVVSELMRVTPSAAVLAWRDELPRRELFVTAVTEAEVRTGVAILPDSARRRGLADAAERAFGGLFAGRVLPFDSGAARVYADIVAASRAARRPVSQSDCRIAAIALTGHGLGDTERAGLLRTRRGSDRPVGESMTLGNRRPLRERSRSRAGPCPRPQDRPCPSGIDPTQGVAQGALADGGTDAPGRSPVSILEYRPFRVNKGDSSVKRMRFTDGVSATGWCRKRLLRNRNWFLGQGGSGLAQSAFRKRRGCRGSASWRLVAVALLVMALVSSRFLHHG